MVIPLDDNGEPHSCRHKNPKTGFGEIKNVLDVEKISSLMKTICQFQGNMFPDWATGKPHDCPERA